VLLFDGSQVGFGFDAAKILPVVKNQHLLLCTLLICNAAAMEVYSIRT